MIYLSGAIRDEFLGRLDVGVILTERRHMRPDLSRSVWAADNGCFAQGDTFDLDGYIARLDSWPAEYRRRCLFATAPDVVGDAKATLARSRPVLPVLRAMGYRAAFVAQDGLEALPVPWDEFDALFIGGTTPWKLSAHAAVLLAQADARGKWTHVGRVNSFRRLKAFGTCGVDSADGTYAAFGPDINTPKLLAWVGTLAQHDYEERANEFRRAFLE